MCKSYNGKIINSFNSLVWRIFDKDNCCSNNTEILIIFVILLIGDKYYNI